jgi:hypothetical protein
MYGRRLKHLTEDQLRQEIAVTAENLYNMQQELESRSGQNSVMYECEECGFRHSDDEVVFDHLVEVHRYPDEDAGLSTLQIFV